MTEHINGGSSEVSTLEGIHQCLFIQDFTARSIYQNGSRRQHNELFAADDIYGRISERNMQGENVTSVQQVGQRRTVFNVLQPLNRVRIIGRHLEPECAPI